MLLDQWESRLVDAIEAARHKPFEWGQHDCCLFAADVVAAITGTDYATDLRGTYDTRQEARAILKGYGGVEAYVEQYFEPTPLTMVKRGDLVLYCQAEAIESLGICLGKDSAFVTLAGLTFVPTRLSQKAWSIRKPV